MYKRQDKAALRVGYVSGTNWDKDSIGYYSFATGNDVKAIGLSATAMGYHCIATGNYSTSLGGYSFAIGDHSTAMGQSTASGQVSTAMGQSTASSIYSTAMGLSTASGIYSTAMGEATATGYRSTAMGIGTANGDGSVAMGYSTANGQYSVAMGSSTAGGIYSTAMGYTTTRADYSTAIGNQVVAKSTNETVVGAYNDTSSTNRIFEIGNGSYGNPGNAVTVLNNGMVGVGTTNPNALIEIDYLSSSIPHLLLNQTNNGYARLSFQNTLGKSWTIASIRNSIAANDAINFYSEQVGADRFSIYGNGNATLAGTLTQNSDERLKINIHSVNKVLPTLDSINAYTYQWKEENRGKEVQIGFLAQEIERTYPQLVRTDDKGIKSVAYQNMVPVLLQAIKEQEAAIKEQQSEFEKQKQENKMLQKKFDTQQNEIDELKQLIQSKKAKVKNNTKIKD